MSNIYIQEPPTSGKVLLKTTVGDIDIELWARETPKACRNFIQLCMEGYYNGTIFHRLVKGFIVQGGDPNGNGSGGESIYSEPFKDEFHSRLRFTRRGLLAMANSGPNDNGSQFFFTLGATPELQNKHTLFGKITGDTIYNMLKLEDGLVDENERPLYPHKIIKTEILNNPFDDIEPRIIEKEVKTEKKEKRHEKGVKNFGLLSFGAEAEEDEAETTQFVKKIAGKSKSTHDVLDDPKLSKEVYKVDKKLGKRSPTPEIEEFNKKELNENEIKETTEKIRSKLKGNVEKQQKQIEKKDETSSDDSDDDYLNDVQKEKNKNRKRQAEKIREEILEVKKQYKEDKKRKFELMDSDRIVEEEKKQRSELMEEYLSEKDKYTHLKKDLPKKGAPREQFTLQLLAKFKSKLDSIKDKTDDSDAGQSSKEIVNDSKAVNDDNDDDIEGDNWLSHELHFVEKLPVLAKDAATKEDDWYDVYDPRNPLNKRRRGADQRKAGRNESDQKYSRRRDDTRQK